MLQDIYKDAAHRMDQAVEHSRMELAKVRTGRANPDLLNSIQVEYYGSMMPLKQVSNISVPEPRLITIQPFEKSLISVIEKGIMESSLGLTPSNNGNAVLVPIPALSEERRKDLIKYVHQLIEEGRIAVRNVRRDALHHVKDFGQKEHVSEDEIRKQENEIQTLTDDHVGNLNEIQEQKEKELMDY